MLNCIYSFSPLSWDQKEHIYLEGAYFDRQISVNRFSVNTLEGNGVLRK